MPLQIAEPKVKTGAKARWRVSPPVSAEIAARFPHLHPVTLRLLVNRGVTEPEAVEKFLNPDFEKDLHDPFLFRNMRQACERVWSAMEKGEPVVIHGDYDADGVTGSTVLMTTFRAVAAKRGIVQDMFSSYIPHREKEGYGVRIATVDKLATEGAKVMITVDCGISCAPEIAHAKKLGIDTIVVDHHQLAPEIPNCLTIHPLVPGETYPFNKLAAVGVSYKFACAFITFASEKGVELEAGFSKWLLDLVSIATVTDVVPLVGENRTLERFGLMVLNKTKRIGLRKLLASAGLELGKLDTTSVGFFIGPRINAASRMEHAELAFKCLNAETEEDAAEWVGRLEQANRDRQEYTEKLMIEARKMVAEMGEKKAYAVRGEGWNPGVVGLVAGKLVTETGRPVFVFGDEDGHIVGSGRSIPGFNLVEAMTFGKEYLSRYGGHPQACGLTIEGRANFEAFERALDAYAEQELAGKDLRPLIPVEMELRASQADMKLVDELAKLEPFGEANPRPRFLLQNLYVVACDKIGKTGKTVRMSVRGDLPKETKLIGFNFAEKITNIYPGAGIDAVVEVGINEWNGRKEVQLRLVDIALSGKAVIERS